MKNASKYILMVRPAAFGYNPNTAADNAFQHQPSISLEEQQKAALAEFNGYVKALKAAGVSVIEVFDTPEPKKPDAIFPNNWFSTHDDGNLFLYPMKAEARRWERRRSILDLLKKDFEIKDEVDLSHYEQDHRFLEGTGSLILDRINKIGYACISQRTDKGLLEEFCQKSGYEMVAFAAKDATGSDIYHTNVMMSVGTEIAVICTASIPNATEQKMVLDKLKSTGKEIIEVSLDQMNKFTCNVLEATNDAGETIWTMSERAYKAYTPQQIAVFEKYGKIVNAPLYTIEDIGGGGSRCMMAEIYLPEK